jgi:hypothetical protein
LPIPNTDVWDNPGKYGIRIKENYDDYWYFDSKEFGIHYDYMGGDEPMYVLRDKIMDYYDKNYRNTWTKEISHA